MSTLHQTINALASEFAHSLVRALRGASLDEILAETAKGHHAASAAKPHRAAASPAAPKGRGGRRHRRSTKELDGVIARIVALVKAHKKGLRSEDIRKKLGLQRRDIQRPLGVALQKKLVTKKGKRRATTYYA
jgi:hypothetical protein